MSNFDWPLNDSHFTMWDRIRIAKFFLNPKNRWSQGELVKKYEQKWAAFVGSKYAVMTSSGSTANTLMAMYVKDSLGGEFKKRNRVILPVVTWQTSVSPWIREGCRPVFVDINKDRLCMDVFKAHEKIKTKIEDNSDRVACVFPTSLLGMNPDVSYLKQLQEEFPEIKFMMDNCESSFGTYVAEDNRGLSMDVNISNLFTSSTSMYFGHQTTTGSEGGMIFTNSQEEYEYFLMARNHGMVRGLEGYENTNPEKFYNKRVDPRFDFNLFGNNYRSSDIAAFIGLLDFEKIEKHKSKRRDLTEYFISVIGSNFFCPSPYDTLFALPIIPLKRKNSPLRYQEITLSKTKAYCKLHSIEYRPIISGSLLKHTSYKNYRKGNYPNANEIHKYGLYVGLYPNLSKQKIKNLVTFLNYL